MQTKKITRSIIKQMCSFALLFSPICFFGDYSWSASHSDAPLIKQDPQANITDVYAFIGTKFDGSDQKMLNVIVQVRPFSEPGDGPIYDRFADDALYSIHIANPETGETIDRYDFQFSKVNPLTSPELKNSDTILSYGLGTEVGAIASVGDARQNYTQYLTVMKNDVVIGDDLMLPPPNVGRRTTPDYNDTTGFAISGATTFDELDSYTKETIYEMPSGEVVFAGPREDGFYADTAAIFDLLDARILGSDGFGQTGDGVDSFKGFNVLAYAIQIPVESLTTFPYNDAFFGSSTGVGVYASVSRGKGKKKKKLVNRMGNPLFNELFVALNDKDNYNKTFPGDDAANYADYARNPELALLINAVFGTSFQETDLEDLVSVFIPYVLRLNTTTDPVTLPGQSGFDRLGFLDGDTTSGFNSGWPNGRRFGDDVVDIALTALASGPSYSTITLLGDNVNANDQVYHQVFPYAATPHAGANNRKDP